MNIETALYFLDTNSKVSCPEITAQQARELAELLREMDRTEKRHAREWSELLGERDEWHVREVWLEQKTQRLMKERDEARAAHDDTQRWLDGRNKEIARLNDVAANLVATLNERTRERDEERAEVALKHEVIVPSDVEVDASDYERPGRAATRDPREVGTDRLWCNNCRHLIGEHKPDNCA